MGFVVLFFGILIFNEILILPFMKMKEKTRYERPDSFYARSPGMTRRSQITLGSKGDFGGPMIIITESEPNLGLGAARATAQLGSDSSQDFQDAPPPTTEHINATIDEQTEDGEAAKN
jgi:hypothetical protein